MEQYVIKGGNPLSGEVNIIGAKNAALAIIDWDAASRRFEERTAISRP